MFLLLIQVVAPLLLLLALAVRARSRATKALQAVAVFAYLLAVHRAGLWLELPWWTPWVYWLIYLAALAAGWRLRKAGPSPGWRGWLFPVLWGLAAIAAGVLAVAALRARIPPEEPLIDLASALPPGRYLVVNGGSSSLTNAHLKTLHPTTARQAAHRGQSYGVDIVGLTPFGRSSEGWRPRDPGLHAIFGTAILAPCDGRVVQRLDNRPDMPVPLPDQQVMAGNHVLLQCGEVQVLLAHMRRGSVAVRQGESVRTGQRLGEVGNSGNSDAPHLHIHAQRAGSTGAPLAADPLPFRLDGRYLVRGDRL